jgi:hypothetical protein
MDGFDADKVARTGVSKRDRLRAKLRAVRAAMAAEGRNHARLQRSLYAGYACEGVIRAAGAAGLRDDMVLKGGTMHRVWNGDMVRPTLDVDFQVPRDADEAEMSAVRDRLVAALASPAFAEETGLVVDPGRLTATPIMFSDKARAWRLEGPVELGLPERDGMRTDLCVEVNFAFAPDWLYERRDVASLVPKEAPVPGVLVTTRAWMAAEKLHAVVWHGARNSRFKDVYDLVYSLMPHPGLPDADLRRALDFVVESKATCSWPAVADYAVGLTAAFATSENERIWRGQQWDNFEGRPFDPARDLPLASACELLAAQCEERGLLARSPVAAAAAALEALAAAADAGAAAAALRALSGILDEVDPRRVAARWDGLAWRAGRAPRRADEAFAAAMERLRAVGAARGLDALWGAGLRDAVAGVAAALSPTQAAPAPAARPPQERARADVGRLVAVMSDPAQPSRWTASLAALVKARLDGDAEGPLDVPDSPLPQAVAARAWEGVARRHGLEMGMEEALGIARGRAAAPGP